MRSARQEWEQLGIGPNVMTPDAVSYGFIDTEYVYEISEGTGFVGEQIVGVSVRRIGGDGGRDEFSREWSELLFDRRTADEWIELARESRKETAK